MSNQDQKHEHELVFGLDLGTSNSCLSVILHDGRPKAITTVSQSSTFPSLVRFPKDPSKPVLVGEACKGPTNNAQSTTIQAVKRLLGRPWSDPTVRTCCNYEYELAEMGITDDGSLVVKDDPSAIQGITVPAIQHVTPDKNQVGVKSPVDVLAEILHYARTDLCAVNDHVARWDSCSRIVITVPACFTHYQRRCTMEAAKKAGFLEVHLINEPSAAAFFAAFEAESRDKLTQNQATGNLLVFDFGGGTLDVSIVGQQKRSDGTTEFTILACDGNTSFGGLSIDQWCANKFRACVEKFYMEDEDGNYEELTDIEKKNAARDTCERRENQPKLRAIARTCKESFSASSSFDGEVTLKCRSSGENITPPLDLTRETLNNYFSSTCKENNGYRFCSEAINRALKKAQLTKDDIANVLLVGGSTRIVGVHEMLRNFFGEKKIIQNVNADTCVSFGAAVHGAIISRSIHQKDFRAQHNIRLVDLIPTSFSIRVLNEQATLKNSTIPIDNQNMSNIIIIPKSQPLSKDHPLIGSKEIEFIPKVTNISLIIWESDEQQAGTRQNVDEIGFQEPLNVRMKTIELQQLVIGKTYKLLINMKLDHEFDFNVIINDVDDVKKEIFNDHVNGWSRPSTFIYPKVTTTTTTPLNIQNDNQTNPLNHKIFTMTKSKAASDERINNYLDTLPLDILISGEPIAHWRPANWQLLPGSIPIYYNSVTDAKTFYKDLTRLDSFWGVP